MRNIFKKILLVLLVIISIAVLIPVTAIVNEETDIGIAKYYVENEKSAVSLPGGVKQYTHIGKTSAKAGEVTDMGMNVTESFVADKYYGQQVSVLEIPSSTEVSLIPWAYIKNSAWSLKTVRQLARDFEAVNKGYKVIAAVNGDFFDISGGNIYPYTPNNLHSSNGDNFKTVYNNRAVGFLNDGSTAPLIGNKPINRNEKPTLAIYDKNDNIIKEFIIDKVNQDPQENEIAVIYPKYYVPEVNKEAISDIISVKDAYIVDDGEYSIPFSKVAKIYGYVSDDLDFFGKGIITKYGNGMLGANDFAIKSNNQEVNNALSIGAKIRVQYEFTGAFADVDNIIGVSQRVLYDGKKVDNITQRAPRTIVGVRADGTIILSVIDGRQPAKQMYGAAMAEMAAIMTHYGAVEAYNLDGGGSSTMIIMDDDDFQVVNSYSDSKERSDANALLVVIKTPVIDIVAKNITDTSISFDTQVLKANGYELNNLYMKLNNETRPITTNTVTFASLLREQEYTYEILYKKNNDYMSVFITGKVKTAKREPKFYGVDIKYSGNDLIFDISYLDSDNTIVSGTIRIGDVTKPIVEGLASFKKFKGNSFDDFEITFVIDTKNTEGEVTQVLTNLNISSSIEVLIDYSMDKFNKCLQDIFK